MPGYFREIVPDGNDLADLKGLKQGNLRLAVITTAKYFVPRLLGPFRHRYPGINISPSHKSSASTGAPEQNLDDLYILGQPPSNLDISLRRFGKSLVVIAPHNHPLAQEKNIPLRLAEEPFIMREPGSELEWQWNVSLKRTGYAQRRDGNR